MRTIDVRNGIWGCGVTDSTCFRCGDIDDDHRTLSMRCGYDMSELNISLLLGLGGEYTMSVCKRCRSQWMKAIKHWFKNIEPKREVGSGIFIREFGDNVEITMEEWLEHREKRAKENYV